MTMAINNFLRVNGFTLRSVYSWEATRGTSVIFKLWRRDSELDSEGNMVVRCLRPQRPDGVNGPRWDRRREAVLNVASGRLIGYATLGDERQNGNQRTYVGFNVDGLHRVLAIRREDENSYLAVISQKLVPLSAPLAAEPLNNGTCEVLLGNAWHPIGVSTLLENGKYRQLNMRCPVCQGPARLERRSAPGKKRIMRDRFEHESHTLHDGCPLIKRRFKGLLKLSPFRKYQPAVIDRRESDDGDYISEEEASRIVADVPDQTEREQLIRARIGQGRFRTEVIALWGTCCVTNCEAAALLVASHIVPWREGTNFERLDPFNGLLLSPTLDRLFDKHLISFEGDGGIIVSNRLSASDIHALGVDRRSKLRTLHSQQQAYMTRHRDRLRSLDALER